MVSRGSGTEDKPLLEPTNLDTNQFYAILRSLQAHDISTSIGQGKENGDLTSAYKYIQENIVREIIGPIATPDIIHFTNGLPKTRSGKIMRRILRKIAANEHSELGDTSTLADPTVVEELIQKRKNI